MLGQRSNQLNYVPNLCSYLYRKTACLVAFLRFNRFACFNPIEPNSEVYRHQAKTAVQKCAAGKRQLRAAVPAPCVNCSRGNSDLQAQRICSGISTRQPVGQSRGNRTHNHGMALRTAADIGCCESNLGRSPGQATETRIALFDPEHGIRERLFHSLLWQP